MMNDMEFRQYGSGVTDETPYVYGISMNEACTQVLAVYATEKTVWVVRVENVEGAAYELDPMIFLITGWEYRDPEVK